MNLSEPILKGSNHIMVCEPNLGKLERKYLMQAYDSSWISSAGSFVARFEGAFAKTVTHTKAAIAVNSGTSALHLAIASLSIEPGDEIILPTFTMIATLNVITYCGAKPILVDADPTTWNIDVTKIEKAVGPKTKAIIVVHTYGSVADMDPIMALCKKHNLFLIEDAAEAHGAIYKGRPAGNMGDVAAFSLYANKLITTGEGGMVTTNNKATADRVRLLRNHAFTENRHFWHEVVGFGYRMTNLQAAVGLAQVTRFDELFAAKRRNAALYKKLLSRIPGITLPYESAKTTHSYWMYGILVDKKRFGINKVELRKVLADHGIETRSFFIPMHLQPAYAHQFHRQHFPVSESLSREGLYLPSSTTLTIRQIHRICDVIKKASL